MMQGVPTAGRYEHRRSTPWSGTVRPTSAPLVVRGRSPSPRPDTQMYMAPLASTRGQRPTQALRLNAHQTHSNLHSSPAFVKLKSSTNRRRGEPPVTDSQSGDRLQNAAQNQHVVKGFACQAKRTHLGTPSTARNWMPQQQPDAFGSVHMNRSSQVSLLALRKGSSNSWTSGSSSAESGYVDRGTTVVECAYRAPPYHHTAPRSATGQMAMVTPTPHCRRCLHLGFTDAASCSLSTLPPRSRRCPRVPSHDDRGDDLRRPTNATNTPAERWIIRGHGTVHCQSIRP